ncbi:MAG TPA: hypothetical protein VGG95_06870, partial [Edaphobacter sp.]
DRPGPPVQTGLRRVHTVRPAGIFRRLQADAVPGSVPIWSYRLPQLVTAAHPVCLYPAEAGLASLPMDSDGQV